MATKSEIPTEIVQRYDEIIARHPVLERKGKNNPYTSHNTYMTSYLTKEFKMVLRMSKEQILAFNEQYKMGPVISYGAVMKDFVQVPDNMFLNDELIDQYVDQSFIHADGLKEQPRKKK